ncbi:MAG: glycoside hydrolase, partial [Bacteroidota bacterium]|nr:glycoside hydrolase [Bacteroidota bacterium]MDX5430569.1 glycoside hydrolase [Bacteroidota bacterium]MDX5469321.1 glycoside hydrolase [Bacteroidota bacterium]
MRYTGLIFLSIFLLIYSIPALSQVINKSDNNPNEVSIAVNHQNEAQILVASNINNLYVSADSGIRWTEMFLESPLGIGGDPNLFCDDSGHFYYAHLSKTPGKKWPGQFDRMVVQKSMDGGNTWSPGVGVGYNQDKMQDKEWLSGDFNSQSPYYGQLYLSWTQFDVYGSSDPKHQSHIRFSVSKDRGRSFTEPITVSDWPGDCKDGDQTLEGATVAIGPKGEIYMVWAGGGKLWFDVSMDGGKSFGTDRIIDTLKEGWTLDIPEIYRSNGMPFIACDPVKGDLWITFADRNANETSRICLLHSNDGGLSWTKKRISDDQKGDAFTPNLVVNPGTGQVGIVYYQS